MVGKTKVNKAELVNRKEAALHLIGVQAIVHVRGRALPINHSTQTQHRNKLNGMAQVYFM